LTIFTGLNKPLLPCLFNPYRLMNTVLYNAVVYCPKQLVIKKCSVFCAVPAYKIDQIINETGPTAKIWIK
jgi:hypothetical protein